MDKPKTFVYVGVTGAMLMWALSYIWFKIVNEQYPPFAIVFLRMLISSVMMLAVAGMANILQRLDKKDFPVFFLLALIYPVIYFIAESTGLTMINATLAAVIISTIPLFVPIGAYLILNERITLMNILGIIISFTGVIIVVLGNGFSINNDIRGILLMLLAVLCAAGYTLMVKSLIFKYNAYTITTYQNIIGTIMFLPLFLIFDWKEFISANHDMRTILNLSYLAVFGSTIPFILFNISIKTIGATKTETFTNLIPVLTAVFAWKMLDEELGLQRIIGIVVVLAGLFLSQLHTFSKPYRHLASP